MYTRWIVWADARGAVSVYPISHRVLYLYTKGAVSVYPTCCNCIPDKPKKVPARPDVARVPGFGPKTGRYT